MFVKVTKTLLDDIENCYCRSLYVGTPAKYSALLKSGKYTVKSIPCQCKCGAIQIFGYSDDAYARLTCKACNALFFPIALTRWLLAQKNLFGAILNSGYRLQLAERYKDQEKIDNAASVYASLLSQNDTIYKDDFVVLSSPELAQVFCAESHDGIITEYDEAPARIRQLDKYLRNLRSLIPANMPRKDFKIPETIHVNLPHTIQEYYPDVSRIQTIRLQLFHGFCETYDAFVCNSISHIDGVPVRHVNKHMLFDESPKLRGLLRAAMCDEFKITHKIYNAYTEQYYAVKKYIVAVPQEKALGFAHVCKTYGFECADF